MRQPIDEDYEHNINTNNIIDLDNYFFFYLK